jgi:thiol-disulfide isomerase/thioredoxin
MRLVLTVALIAIINSGILAQYKVEGTLSGILNENILLLEYFGDEHRIADSTRSDGNGWFSFEMKASAPSGLYSLALGSNPLFNFIYNNEDVVLKYDPSGFGLPEFIRSAENLIYYDYLVQDDRYKQQSAMLIDILQYYPARDSFRIYTQAHFQNLQDEYRSYTERILEEYPGTLISHIIKSDRPALLPPDINWDEYLHYLRAHYLDEINFNDTLLLNTNVFTSKAIDYLGFYSVNSQNKELQEQYFIQAVDSILHRAMDNGRVYDFLMKYLIDGFEMYGFDRVISHIAANYEPANTCVNEERKSELEKRVENLRRLAVGNFAPDIRISKPDGKEFSLTEIDTELTVILFWASWCPHCNAMIPGLKDLYEDPGLPKFEILAMSVDTSATDYNEALSQHTTSWINYAELNGWDSKAAVDYSIYATPTMFILDRNRMILARPVTVSDLRHELGKLR